MTNVINDTNFEIPYGEIKNYERKVSSYFSDKRDQHIIILDKLQMSIAQQDELLRIIHKKNAVAASQRISIVSGWKRRNHFSNLKLYVL